MSDGEKLLKEFHHLVEELHGPVEGLPEGKEKARAKQVYHDLSQGMEWLNRPPALEKKRNDITELERLLAGQQMLFEASVANRVARRFLALHTTEIFKKLLDVLDAAETRMSGGGAGTPQAPQKRGPKAPKTYKQAQDAILAELHKAGWSLSGNLKIPHATNKEGTFRLWFKPQAIWFTAGREVSSFHAARSLWAKDYRFEDAAKFAKGLEAYAAKHAPKGG